MKKWLRLAAGALVIAGAVTADAAEPARRYEPVPARLVRPRDGLGNVFAKLKAGGAVRIAYFGGSITAQNGWRVKTLDWFRKTYPAAQISEINAAIGGTGSDLGVYRFRQDVLRHKPDLVFVEFAVNDGGAAPENIWRAMEGIVRQAWKADPRIDLCYVYTFRTGYEQDLLRGFAPRAASADEILADHYGIPSINVALRTAELARQNKLVFTPGKDDAGGLILFSEDGVHPLDAGHQIYADVITAALADMAATSRPGPHALKPLFLADNWEQAQIAPLEPWMLSAGWKKLDTEAGLGKQFQQRLPEIWEATKPGETITFSFRGRSAGLYDVMGPDAGQAIVTLDGVTGAPRPRFDSFSSYHRLASLTLGAGLEDALHTVTVAVHPEQPDRRAVTEREMDKPGFDPARYHGTVLRVGGILVLGEIVRPGNATPP